MKIFLRALAALLIIVTVLSLTACGTDGKDGIDGKDGVNGKDGVDGKNGLNGKNGDTPYIGENGNWWMGDEDLGVNAGGDDGVNGAQGEKGDPGTPGLSGYEVAKTNGFSGTYEQWVNLMKGDTDAILDMISDGSDVVSIGTYIAPDNGGDVADRIQSIIDENPNKTIYFPDGVYYVSKPILTSADPAKSVSLRMGNYAVIKAKNWTGGSEAMLRIGAKDSSAATESGVPCYVEGGIFDGSSVANGISVEGGFGTRLESISIKNTKIGVHLKSGSSNTDVLTVNVTGTRHLKSYGVLCESSGNTFDNMRIAGINIGVYMKASGNYLRDLHPLYGFGNELNKNNYTQSYGFYDESDYNWYDICYSDQFSNGFGMKSGSTHVYENCFAYWYSGTHGPEVGFECNGIFNATIRSAKISFNGDSDAFASNAYLKGATSGNGIIEFPILNDNLSHIKTYKDYTLKLTRGIS